MKITTGRELTFAEPAQFFGYAAQAMRHILVDRARQRLRIKRGSGVVPVDIVSNDVAADATAENALELDEALKKLERDDPRAAELVALHYFAGLPLPRIAEILGVTERTRCAPGSTRDIPVIPKPRFGASRAPKKPILNSARAPADCSHRASRN